uniref:Uncharacterized protein n=1 Tax=Zea mays TaxID=4577 RepID=A0A804PLI7_MAIZE
MFGAAGSNPNLDIKHISIAGTIGNLTLRAYEEDCEFADPAGSLRGLRRFKRNCTNFGSLLEKSNMKLTKWEDLESLLSSRHVENWNVRKMALLRQIFRPSRWVWEKR